MLSQILMVNLFDKFKNRFHNILLINELIAYKTKMEVHFGKELGN